jgi:hypothetical protein
MPVVQNNKTAYNGSSNSAAKRDGFPGSRGPGIKKRALVVNKKSSKKNLQSKKKNKNYSSTSAIASSTTQFLEIENFNAAERNTFQQETDEEISNRLETSDFLMQSFGRIPPPPAAVGYTNKMNPPSTTTTVNGSSNSSRKVKEQQQSNVGDDEDDEDDIIDDFIPYDANMLTPNGKNLIDDDDDQYEPEDYEQYQQREALTTYSQEVSEMFQEQISQLLNNVPMGGGSSHTKLNHKTNIDNNTEIGIHRPVDDRLYEASNITHTDTPISRNIGTGDNSKSENVNTMDITSTAPLLVIPSTLSPKTTTIGNMEYMNDMNNNNNSPSSTLSNTSSTNSEQIGKATVRIDTKNVDGVSF